MMLHILSHHYVVHCCKNMPIRKIQWWDFDWETAENVSNELKPMNQKAYDPHLLCIHLRSICFLQTYILSIFNRLTATHLDEKNKKKPHFTISSSLSLTLSSLSRVLAKSQPISADHLKLYSRIRYTEQALFVLHETLA